MIILFPRDPLNAKQPDDNFVAEESAAKLVGFETFLFDHDEFVRTSSLKTNLPKNDGQVETIILRGWMLKKEQYLNLHIILIESGYQLINNTEEYINCHYFPNSYKHICDYTSKSWWSGEWSGREEANNPEDISWGPVRDLLDRGDLIIKDYVKSEKGNPELFILNKELSNEEFGKRIGRFIEARGKLFNYGIVLKKVEPLKKYEGQTNEFRLFFVNNKLFTWGYNVDDTSVKAPMMPFELINALIKIGGNIKSNFFTIDIAEKEDGSWMVLETGDGQVSGLPNAQEAIKFYNTLNNALIGVEQN